MQQAMAPPKKLELFLVHRRQPERLQDQSSSCVITCILLALALLALLLILVVRAVVYACSALRHVTRGNTSTATKMRASFDMDSRLSAATTAT